MAFKKLTAAEVRALDDDALITYLEQVAIHEPFDWAKYIEDNYVPRKPRKPNCRPTELDEENPDATYSILGATIDELDRLGVTGREIVDYINDQVEKGELYASLGYIPPIERIYYEHTKNGITGYGNMIRNYFQINPKRIGVRIYGARMTGRGIHVDFLPDGPCKHVVEQWINQDWTSFRFYPRVGLNVNLEPQFITFDMDREIIMP